MEAASLLLGPTIADQAPKLSELEREALKQRVRREERQRGRERESVTAAASRALGAADCGCQEPGDYLTRELESSFRCPHAVAPGRGPSRGRGA